MIADFSANTISGRLIQEMTSQGYQYRGYTTGWLTLRKGSNLRRKLDDLGIDPTLAIIRQGASLRYRTQGTQLLIFTR